MDVDVMVMIRKERWSVKMTLQRELTLILGLKRYHDFLKSWPEWQRKIIAYGSIEAPKKSSFKTLVESHETCSDDYKDIYCLHLLHLLLARKSKERMVYEYEDTVDIDEEVAKVPSAPCIIIMKSDHNTQFFIAVEKQILTESTALSMPC